MKLIVFTLIFATSSVQLASAQDSLYQLFPEGDIGSGDKARVIGNFDEISSLNNGKTQVFFRKIKPSDTSMPLNERALVNYTDSSQEKIERISFIRDRDKLSEKHFSSSEGKTATLNNGKVESYTECSYFMQADRPNKGEKDRSYLNKLFSKAPKEVILESCFTVTRSICEGINQRFDTIESANQKNKECIEFSENLNEAVSDDYYKDEVIARNNTQHLVKEYNTLSPTPKGVERVVKVRHHNLLGVARNNSKGELKKVGKMLDLCEKINFKENKVADSSKGIKGSEGSEVKSD